MNIIILDLEWNGSYSRRLGRFINEIIEFGAVKCDENLQVLDTFSALVKPLVGKRISNKIEVLTSITNESLQEGIQYTQAVSRFKKWMGQGVLLTFGTSDILALIENCRYYYGRDAIPFLTDYVNMQYYCEERLGVGHAHQMGLYTMTQQLGIAVDDSSMHSALADSLASLQCLQRVYTKESMAEFIEDGRLQAFYDKIQFKTTYICDMSHPLIKRSDFIFRCEKCGGRAHRKDAWKLKNKSFRAQFECRDCAAKFIGQVQFKLKYEGITVKKKVIPIIEKPKSVRLAQMLYTLQNGVGVLRFEAFEKTGLVHHGFSTRLGGVSEAEFSSMNLGLHRGDDPKRVEENYRRFCQALDVDENLLVAGAQDHHTGIMRVNKQHAGAGITGEKLGESIDGLCTDEPGVTLVIYCADCVPVYFLDPVRHAIGLCHAGWRGTVAGMAACMVKQMQHQFGTQPADLLVGIGPSIGPCCFEIDQPVAAQFAALPQSSLFLKALDQPGKFRADLWECNRQFLLQSGVKEENITVGGVCTMCNSGLLFSHRATGGRRGSNAAMLCLLDPAQQENAVEVKIERERSF